jgi:tetratricopeptide (TPR) repeat protein
LTFEDKPKLSDKELEEKISILSQEIEFLKKEGRKSEYIHNLYELALFQANYDKFDEALQNLKICLKYFEESADNFGIGLVYGSMGVIYYLSKDYPKSLYSYKEACQISERLFQKREQIVCLKGIGLNLMKLNELDEAVDVFLNCAEFSSKENRLEDFLDSISNIIQIYEVQEKWDVMIELYLKALEAFEQLQDVRAIINTHFNLGILYNKLEMYDEALSHFKKGTNIANEANIVESIIKGLSLVGEVYVRQNKLKKATQEFIKSLSVAKKVSANNAIEQLKILLNAIGLNNEEINIMLQKYESELD